MYSILIEDGYGYDRDEVIAGLKRKGVDNRPFFYPSHVMPPYQTGQHLPVAEALSRKGINLPSGPRLTEEQIHLICQILKEKAF